MLTPLLALPPTFMQNFAGEGAKSVDRTNLKVQNLLYQAMMSFMKDKAKSKALYQQASDLGSVRATIQLATNFYTQNLNYTILTDYKALGHGVIKNDPAKYIAHYEKALKLYQEQGGDKAGSLSLQMRVAIAGFYATSSDVHSTDYTKAVHIWESLLTDLSGTEHIDLNTLRPFYSKNKLDRGNEWGVIVAALNFLGRAYQEGWGVPQDLKKARAFLQKAADFGSLNSLAILSKLDQTPKVQPCPSTIKP
ncbi:tetratricopeptide repeat protein [Helicobacter felis]|uniref:tetratricopeptide repeat protein n=1 Tax=Helicobacter felis TaxID=214 RepID=UPI0013158162|nr:SEL1-like repeat protein [Helicobacter felis]